MDTAALHLAPPLTDRDAWSAEGCSMAAALSVVGTRGVLLCLREAFYGARRFEEFTRRTTLSDAVVAARLKELVAEGLLAKRPYREPGQRAREEYVLTEKGVDLLPALVALMQWGDRWLAPEGHGPITLRHAGECAEPVRAELRCSAGHPVALADLEARADRSAARPLDG
jgi:DNA-binding HxlR family transcriptional regulator